jgi:hypothetical protein
MGALPTPLPGAGQADAMTMAAKSKGPAYFDGRMGSMIQ